LLPNEGYAFKEMLQKGEMTNYSFDTREEEDVGGKGDLL